MRRILFGSLVASLALAGAPAFAVQAPPAPAASQVMAQRFSAAELAQLKRVSTYLNGIKNVQGRFLQISASGATDQGTFYLRKPGRVRFEYAKPNPNLVVADGTTVAVENSQLKTTDRYPLLNSPLRLLLSENIDLTRDTRIVSAKSEQGLLSVTAREDAGPAAGSITLTFADSGTLELRQWEVLDAQGARTAVIVNEMRKVADIPARLFVIEDLSPFK
jgi:outer membrane lipoprotein-sorting protein